MRFNAPKKATWWAAFVFLILGTALLFFTLLTGILEGCHLDSWSLLVSAVLYALGTSMKGF